jgi:hypothetical protein
VIGFGFLDFITKYDPSLNKNMPEVMRLDEQRIRGFNSLFHTDAVSATILTQVDQASFLQKKLGRHTYVHTDSFLQELRNRSIGDPLRCDKSRQLVMKNVVDIIKRFPPIPGPRLQECIQKVMNEISVHLRTDKDREDTEALINKHIMRTSDVYVHFVSPPSPILPAFCAVLTKNSQKNAGQAVPAGVVQPDHWAPIFTQSA